MTSDTIAPAPPSTAFARHPLRGPFNAAFFQLLGPSIERALRARKERVFAGLPRVLVEIGPGVGANLRYLPPRATVIGIEPNTAMHGRLGTAARLRGLKLDLRERMAEDTGLPDHSVDAVISSLVLCTVADPAAVLAEVRRILRPGGTFRFVEHVRAREGTLTRAAQRLLRRPWTWTFEGCSCERDLAHDIRWAGFAHVEVEAFRIRTPFLPFNTQIAGVATA